MEAKNIDDVIVSSENEQLANLGAQQVNDTNVASIEPPKPQEEVQPTTNDQVEVKELPKETKQDSTIDEYGNPVEKPKMYSEEEVNRLIRERLSRGKFAEQQTQQPQPQVQQQTQEQEEDWEAQLETFVEKTIEKRQAKLSEQQWRQQELAKQVEFEDKFTNGMSKYSDFKQVVAGKNITDSMMLATRNLENPAAFVYGAAKFHAPELERISKISDPYSQAAEIGRLHEKMIKSKSIVSSAPKPVEVISGDMPAKNVGQFPSLEDRIDQYAKQKRK